MNPQSDWLARLGESIRWVVADFGRFLHHIFTSQDIVQTAFGGQWQDGLYFLAITLGIGFLFYVGYLIFGPLLQLFDWMFDLIALVVDRVEPLWTAILSRLPIVGRSFSRQRVLRELWFDLIDFSEEAVKARGQVWSRWIAAQRGRHSGASDWLTPIEASQLFGPGFPHLLEAARNEPKPLLKAFDQIRVPTHRRGEKSYRDHFGQEALTQSRRLEIAFLRRWHKLLENRPKLEKFRRRLVEEARPLVEREAESLEHAGNTPEGEFWQAELALVQDWLDEASARPGKVTPAGAGSPRG